MPDHEPIGVRCLFEHRCPVRKGLTTQHVACDCDQRRILRKQATAALLIACRTPARLRRILAVARLSVSRISWSSSKSSGITANPHSSTCCPYFRSWEEINSKTYPLRAVCEVRQAASSVRRQRGQEERQACRPRAFG